MEISIPEIISWIIVGSIAGGFVGSLLTGKKSGYGWFKNLGIGLLGGLVGGVLFVKLIKLDFGMSEVKVTLQDLVAAVLGALILLFAIKFFGKKGAAK